MTEFPLMYATQFTLPRTRVEGYWYKEEVVIEMRGPRSQDRWCIKIHGNVYNSDGEWELEGMPSSRSDEFISRTRFTLAECWEICRKQGWTQGE